MTNPTDKQSDIVAELLPVEQLAEQCAHRNFNNVRAPHNWAALREDVAKMLYAERDEIERLRASNEALTDALMAFIRPADAVAGGIYPDDYQNEVNQARVAVEDHALSHSATKET